MTFNEHEVYLNDGFLKQQNHQRVVRLLREMQFNSHPDRRCKEQQPENDRREEHSAFTRWSEKIWQTLH